MKMRKSRIEVGINCWLEVDEGTYCVSTYDLSDNGVSLNCSDPKPEGSIVRLKFFTPFSAEPVLVMGEVVWSRCGPSGRMGIKFIDLDARTVEILKMAALLLRGEGLRD